MTEQSPTFLTSLCFTAADLRRLIGGLVCGEGVVEDGLAITTGGSGLDLSIAAGYAFVAGDDLADQGTYQIFNNAPVTLTANTADSSNPRIDTVVATVHDSDYGGSADDWVLQILDGTPTSGANLTNLNGAAATPNDTILLAHVLVPAMFTGPFVDVTNIGDARSGFTLCGGGSGVQVDVFSTPGVTSWTKPAGARSHKVTAIGGGGGGGNAVSTGSGESSFGSGGGAGGQAESWFTDTADLAPVCYLSVGSGGAGGSPGSSGGKSTFRSGPNVGDTDVCSAFGGDGGAASASASPSGATSGAGGGGGSVGDVFAGGGPGGAGIRYSSGTTAISGSGGTGPGGGGGVGVQPSNAGTAGRIYGGGGGGACNGASQALRTGGTGGGGLIIVETYF